jgi:hypothetical protein
VLSRAHQADRETDLSPDGLRPRPHIVRSTVRLHVPTARPRDHRDTVMSVDRRTTIDDPVSACGLMGQNTATYDLIRRRLVCESAWNPRRKVHVSVDSAWGDEVVGR